jgi:hypothetical protein
LEQFVPQLIPLGLLVTVPLPFPNLVTIKLWVSELNIAETLVASFICNVHVLPFCGQLLLHPAKLDPLSGVAVKVTLLPEENCALQFAPQLIPAGLLIIVPLPEPVDETFKIKNKGLKHCPARASRRPNETLLSP